MKRSKPILGHARTRVALGMFVCILIVVGALHASVVGERLNHAALDTTQRFVRALSPRPALENVVIVGIDKGTERSFPEPFALWHKHLGEALTAIARGKPKLVALDVVLPERSYDGLVPGLTAELVRGLVAAKHAGGLAIGLRVDAQGRPQPIDGLLLAAAGQDAVALAYAPVDRDGTARRLAPPAGRGSVNLPLLAERVVLSLGLDPHAGIIDFACGQPFAYVPMQDVVAWAQSDPSRLAMFAGKVVFIGWVGPDEDRVRQPLSLASWPAGAGATSPPGVVLLAQSVRALESNRILPTLSAPAQAALVILGACVVLVGGLLRTWTAAVALAALVIGCVYAGYVAGIVVPPTGALAAIILGATTRSSYEAFAQRRFRIAIERQFSGYVSQNLLEAILSGEVDPSRPRKYANLGFMFADLRGFTTLTEASPAEEVLTLLNRYYDAITPAIHAYDGTIDNFRGDGILAIFGAPQAADDGPRRAALATREMFERLAELNRELVGEGRNELRIGIGLAAGEAIAGNVGTASRHGYSAIGDAVNVAARLQSLCKPLQMRVIASEAFWRTCADVLPFVSLGPLELAGHAPVHAYGVPAA